MTGDLGSTGEGAHSWTARRPEFLPPAEGHPPSEPPPGPVPGPARRGLGWSVALIGAATLQLVSAFLPWAQASVEVDLFGRAFQSRELGAIAGIDADGLVLAVPVLALITLVMAFWGITDARITALGTIPGAVSLLFCFVFLLRLSENVPDTGLNIGYRIGVQYGWYLAVAMSLLVIGFSLAHPVAARRPRPAVAPDQS